MRPPPTRRSPSKLAEACPVDIFAQADGGTLKSSRRNLDECVLCGLCLDCRARGRAHIIKLYDNNTTPAPA